MTSAVRSPSDAEQDLEGLLNYLKESPSDNDHMSGPYLMLALGRHIDSEYREVCTDLLDSILLSALRSAKTEARSIVDLFARHGFQVPSRNETDRYAQRRARLELIMGT